MYKAFQRKINAKGFKDLNSFDNFIKRSLDKFTFVDPSEDLYNSVGIYSKYIISNKSTIPDLIIYNKTFNKNDCFEGYRGNQFNKFPRIRFILKAKPKRKPNNKKEFEYAVEKTDLKEEEKKPKEEEQEIFVKKNEEENNSEILDNGNNTEEKLLTNPNMFFEHIKEAEKNINQMKIKVKEKEEESNLDTNKIINNEKMDNNEKNQEKHPIPEKIEELPNKEQEVQNNQDKTKIQPQRQINFSNQILQSQAEVLTFIENKPKVPEPEEKPQAGAQVNKENPSEKEEPHKSTIQNSEKDQKNIKMPFIPPNIPPYMLFPPYNLQTPPGMIPPTRPPLPLNFPPQMMSPLPPQQIGVGLNFNYMSPYPIEDDDEDDNNPIYNNFSEDYKRYNPSIFLENPILIVKKNLFQRNWILMKNNKVSENFNSEELLFFLGDQIRQGNKFDNISISDYHTDVFFKPTNLFDILRKSVPKLKRKLMQLTLSQNNLNKKE